MPVICVHAHCGQKQTWCYSKKCPINGKKYPVPFEAVSYQFLWCVFPKNLCPCNTNKNKYKKVDKLIKRTFLRKIKKTKQNHYTKPYNNYE